MNKILNWTFGSIFRTLGRIIAYFIIGIIAVMIFNAGGFKKPKISNILNDIFFMKVNASEISLSAKYDSTVYSPYTWTDSQAIEYGIISYKLINFDSTTQNSVQTEEIHFNTNFNTNNYDLIEIPFFLSNSIIASHQNFNYDFAYCDDYEISGSSVTCITPRTWANPFDTNAIKFNNNNFQFMLDYVGGGVTQCTYNNNVIVCPLAKNKYIRNINVYYTFAGANFSTYDKFYMNIGQYINFYKYVDSSTDIINNATSNTQNIINNQNQTTQEIINSQQASTNATIENQNQNTQQQIQSNQVCQFIDKNSIKIQNKYLSSNGNEYNSNNWGITDYISTIKTDIKVILKAGSYTSYYCFYNTNKTLLNCYTNDTMVNNQNLVIPDNASYVRFSISLVLNQPQLQVCQNGNQAMANTITDSNVSEANSSAGGFFNNFSTTDNGGLSSIITAPLSAIQGLTSATCSPLVLPLPFVNENLTLPCMRTIYESNFGGFMTLYDVITLGIISYWILVRIFNLVKDFKNPDHDEIEVVDL